MAERRELDETDLTIIRLLAEDARRSYRDIADRVGLSPPAVSDRVDRLHDQGIIRRFTVDLDRSKVEPETPVMLELVAAPGSASAVMDAIERLEGVEHTFQTVDNRFFVHASAPDTGVGHWVRSELNDADLADITVRLVDSYTWTPSLDSSQFSLTCVVCDNPVTRDGVMAEFGGAVKAFCCESCQARYEERYESHQSKAG